MAGSPIDALVHFARVASQEDPAGTLQALADAAVAELGAAASAVFGPTAEGGVQLVAFRNLPGDAAGLEVEAFGPELADAMRSRCGPCAVHVLPLVSGGDLFGALALCFPEGTSFDGPQRELAQGLVDLTALAQRTAAQVHELRRSNADLRTAREALTHAEKLGALGQMAAGIAHDLGNVLGPIVVDVENLRATAAEQRVVKAAARMSRYLQVGRDLLERLRRFARQAPEAGHAAQDPTPAVRDAVELSQVRARAAGVELRAALGPAPSIVVNPSDLTSAVVNLIGNALDAQPDGGTIDVRLGTDAQGRAWLEVADGGPGIPAALRARLFEPFFTTKGERGTGLGLANVYAFVQRHRGAIGVTSAEGAGTTFRLEFPPAG